MTGLQRLWVCTVLQAIAEQDEKYVRVDESARGDKCKQIKQRKTAMLAKHAQDYVASLEFEEVCHLAGLKAEDVRLVSPDNAAEAYFRFQHGEYERPESVLEPEPDESALLEREPTVTELVALELEVEV